MDKKIIFLRLTFYISLILLAIFSLFPGSLLGFLVFGDFTRQPSLADNPIHIFIDTPNYQMGTIINHFVIFFCVSALGFFLYSKHNNFWILVSLLFSLSIILEILHFIIPNRAFEIYDVFANFAGVLFAYFVLKIYRFWSSE